MNEHPVHNPAALFKAFGNPHGGSKGGGKDMKGQNDHPVHDVTVLTKFPTVHGPTSSIRTNGVVNGDLNDMILDNEAVIRKSMEMTGVGDMLKNTLTQLEAI